MYVGEQHGGTGKAEKHVSPSVYPYQWRGTGPDLIAAWDACVCLSQDVLFNLLCIGGLSLFQPLVIRYVSNSHMLLLAHTKHRLGSEVV